MGVRIGDTGRAVTPLSPSGYVEIGGVRRSATTEGTFIEPGRAVVVVRGGPPGFVVRAVEPGAPAEALPHQGEELVRAEHQRTRADVAAADRDARQKAWAELKRRMARGAAAAGAFGCAAGLTNAALGRHFDWAGATAWALPELLLGSAAAGALDAVLLYFFTGWFVARVLPAEADAVFEPSLVAVLAGLVGASLGFWVYAATGDVWLVARWTAGLSLAFAALAAGLAWVVNVLT
ncbi:NfeD family protein [Gemmata sp.]|uniref:NfeD family protein n=1 Tax=Gemmata sp. TaxID=1914242 RepID=UPI003F72EE8F